MADNQVGMDAVPFGWMRMVMLVGILALCMMPAGTAQVGSPDSTDPARAAAPRPAYDEPRPLNVDSRPSTDAPRSNLDPPRAGPDVNSVNPLRYHLSAGDSLRFHLYGAVNTQYAVTVGPDGRIFLGPLGVFNVEGMTIAQAERAVARKVGELYLQTRLAIQLAAVRRFRVTILGEVTRPGTYDVDGLTGACEAIQLSGGLTPIGSSRAIELRGSGPRYAGRRRIDYFRWRLFSDPVWNPALRPGDVIVVPAERMMVRISGEVARPGIYEMIAGETVRDLVKMAGGLTGTADSTAVQLGRLDPSGLRSRLTVNLSEPDSSTSRVEVRNGDQVQVFDRTVGRGTITVVGELLLNFDERPAQSTEVRAVSSQATAEDRNRTERAGVVQGEAAKNKLLERQQRSFYHIRQGEHVRDVLLAFGGPTVRADMDHASLDRPLGDGRVQTIPLNVRQILEADSGAADNVELKDGDTLNVPALIDSVFVLGEVLNPGAVVYQPNFSLRHYLMLAGGLTRQAAGRYGRVVRPRYGQKPEVFEVDLQKVMTGRGEPSFALRPGDIVYAPQSKPFIDELTRLLIPLGVIRGIVP